MRKFRTIGALAAAGVAASGVGAAASTPAELEDDLVILCTPQEEWCEAARAAFEEASGVNTEYVRLSSGEAVARLEAEGDDPSFDVWFGGPSPGPVAAAESGLIEEYVSPNAAAIGDEFKDADGLWTGIYVGALGFCSNVDLLEELGAEAPTSYDALLDPAFEDNIAVADQRTSGTAITLGANVVALRGSEEAAIEYFQALDANIFQYTRSGAAPGQMAAQGEIAVAIIFSHDCIAVEETTGVDLELTFPEEGTGFEVGQVSLIANAAHPNAARAFVDWALTAEAQEVAATAHSYQIPTNPDAAIPEQAVSLEDITLAEEYSPAFAEQLAAAGWADRWAEEVRDGADAPED
jgi:iron(III) transport system substrate-binding protein